MVVPPLLLQQQHYHPDIIIPQQHVGNLVLETLRFNNIISARILLVYQHFIYQIEGSGIPGRGHMVASAWAEKENLKSPTKTQ